MSAAAPEPVFRPPSFTTRLTGFGIRLMPFLLRVARRRWPIPRLGRTYIVTRYDDVRDVYLNDRAFGVPYKENLDVIIEVDGGIDPETAPLAIDAGATALVAGTAAFRGGPSHYAANIEALRGRQ